MCLDVSQQHLLAWAPWVWALAGDMVFSKDKCHIVKCADKQPSLKMTLKATPDENTHDLRSSVRIAQLQTLPAPSHPPAINVKACSQIKRFSPPFLPTIHKCLPCECLIIPVQM